MGADCTSSSPKATRGSFVQYEMSLKQDQAPFGEGRIKTIMKLENLLKTILMSPETQPFSE